MKLKLEKILDFLVILTVLAVLNLVLVNPAWAASGYPSRTGEVAWYHFDENGVDPQEGDGFDFYDETNNNNDGKLGSTGETADNYDPTWTSSMQGLSYALKYEDDPFYAIYSHVPDDMLGGSLDITAKITVEAWIKADSISSTGANCIAIKETYDQFGGPWFLEIYQRKVRFCINTSEATEEHCATGSTSLQADGWYHVAGTYISMTFPTGKIKVYLNGQEDGTADYSNPINTNDDPVTIGTRDGANKQFEGIIDEFRILNRDLTADEIFGDYYQGYKGTVPEFTEITWILALVLSGGIFFLIKRRKEKALNYNK